MEVPAGNVTRKQNPVLLDMPDEVLKSIAEYTCVSGKIALGRCCRKLGEAELNYLSFINRIESGTLHHIKLSKILPSQLHPSNFDALIESAQWKCAKAFEMKGLHQYIDVRKFWHFNTIDIDIIRLSPEDSFFLKSHFEYSTTFKKCVLNLDRNAEVHIEYYENKPRPAKKKQKLERNDGHYSYRKTYVTVYAADISQQTEDSSENE
ncbi:unnamed protein product [Caenorhabditis sp. 36 PRJEB53466]|nr:unnamed protein product [Caenorhabditis sp. 36 PRJEB53466]